MPYEPLILPLLCLLLFACNNKPEENKQAGPPSWAQPESLVTVQIPESIEVKPTPSDSVFAITITANSVKAKLGKGEENTFKNAAGLNVFMKTNSVKGYTITIKADNKVAYPKVQAVIDVLREHHLNHFNLITSPAK